MGDGSRRKTSEGGKKSVQALINSYPGREGIQFPAPAIEEDSSQKYINNYENLNQQVLRGAAGRTSIFSSSS